MIKYYDLLDNNHTSRGEGMEVHYGGIPLLPDLNQTTSLRAQVLPDVQVVVGQTIDVFGVLLIFVSICHAELGLKYYFCDISCKQTSSVFNYKAL